MSAGDEPRVWAKRDRTIVPRQRQLAREMRSAPTEAERKLWWHLRHRISTPRTHFRRQVRIGRYIVDFACHARRVVIEVDGGQHGERSAADDDRTRILEAHGYRENAEESLALRSAMDEAGAPEWFQYAILLEKAPVPPDLR